MDMRFAERFSEVLKVKKINQKDFAKRIGFSQPTVNCWCTGRYEPNLETLFKICRELNESADYLLGLTN